MTAAATTDDTMTLYVKFLGTEIRTIRVSPTRDTMYDILSRLGTLREDPSWGEYRLCYNGHRIHGYQINDQKIETIAKYNEGQSPQRLIKEGAIIHALYTLRGD